MSSSNTVDHLVITIGGPSKSKEVGGLDAFDSSGSAGTTVATLKPKKGIIDVKLDKFATEHYLRYGNAVLEDRAIPDFRDGMNPVNRRILWSAYTLGVRSTSKKIKAARIIGDTMGRFHPHGDSSMYGAMVGMTNTHKGICNTIKHLIEGEGNWGSLTDPNYAAMRYTEARLSKFADAILFDKFYTPLIEMVPNYDSTEKEPLVLPALVPLLFINGRFGIAPGATSNIPSFDAKTLSKVLEEIYSGAPVTSQLLAKHLRCVTTYGGRENGKEATRKDLFSKKKGTVTLHSEATLDLSKRTIIVTKFAKDNMANMIDRISDMNGVEEVDDRSKTDDMYGQLVIRMKRLGNTEMQKLYAKIMDFLSKRENYVLNFTERYIDDTAQAAARMRAMTLVEAFTEWVAWRTDLEKRACAYWIEEAAKDIRKFELLILAVDNRKIIIKSLDRPGSQDELNKWLAGQLKITVEEAAFIYDLRVKQLRALERKTLVAKKMEVIKHKKELIGRKKKPMPFLLKQLQGFKELLA